MNHIICDCSIEYENGAIVQTSFVSSFGGDIVAQTAPDLTKKVNDAVAALRKERVRELPKYTYPDNILTSAMMQRYSKYGVDMEVRRHECTPIYKLDAQAEQKKTIFGGGLLLSKRAAAERAAAERAAAHIWALSDRERAIVDGLG